MIRGFLLWPLLQTTSSITQVVHDSTMSGQIGLPITYQRLIYGLAMKGDVMSLVNCCDVCEMAKSEHFLYPWLLQGLSFLKYWYDTSYHTSLKMSPFTGLYGYTPPFITLYLYLDSVIAAIKNQIKERFQTLEFSKAYTLQVQYIVKVYIDKKRFGRSFEVGEENYLEFILLAQNLLPTGKKQELSSKYFGLYTILANVGNTFYKLELTEGTQIHKLSHVLLQETNDQKSKGVSIIELPDLVGKYSKFSNSWQRI